LHIPGASGRISYTFRDGAVLRESTPGGQREEVLSGVKATEFRREARRQVTAWRWELELRGKQEVSRVKPMFTFQAVALKELKP
jgi:hypothetical protein